MREAFDRWWGPRLWAEEEKLAAFEAWQAAYRAAIEDAAKAIEPNNAPEDWTEHAQVRARCAAAIRGLALT